MEVVILAAIVCFVLLIAGFAVFFTKLLSAQDEIFSPEDFIKKPFFSGELPRDGASAR